MLFSDRRAKLTAVGKPIHPRRVEHLLAIIDRALRATFQPDFHKRCAYAATGIVTLLRESGVPAKIVGGDFCAFALSPDGQRASVQGFADGKAQCAHFWVEGGGRLIDLGPSYLPEESTTAILRPPALAWDLSDIRPEALRYRELSRFAENTEMSSDPEVAARSAAFVERCRADLETEGDFLSFPGWVLTGAAALNIAANRGNKWALGAQRFQKVAHLNRLPF